MKQHTPVTVAEAPMSVARQRSRVARPNYLNLGCGARLHPDWVNVDVAPQHSSVIRHDLSQPIPFPADTFDVVYHSHLLEHLPRRNAQAFMQDCWRVLKRGGVLRVVVPNLEQIAQLYLHALEKASHGEPAWAARYEWLMMELYDQTVRNQSGGEMRRYLMSDALIDEDFVVERVGAEARGIIEHARRVGMTAVTSTKPESLARRIKAALRACRTVLRSSRSALLHWLLGEEYLALEIGRFRLAGEVHQWMYDRLSLAELMRETGFENPTQMTAGQSRVADWASFHLDTEPDGSVRKPDSLFMEAIKPPRG